MSTRSKAFSKFNIKSYYKPDPGVLSSLNSIRQNPKFSRLISFATNCLIPLVTPPNARYRENGIFFIQENGLSLIEKALNDHSKEDELILNSTILLIKLVGKNTLRISDIPLKIIDSGCLKSILNLLSLDIELSKKSLKCVFDLLESFSSINSLQSQLFCLNIIDPILYSLLNHALNPETSKKGLEIVYKLISQNLCQEENKKEIIHKLLDLLQKKSFYPLIVQTILKTLDFMTRNSILSEYLQNSDGLKILVKIMEKYPFEKNLLSLSANILSRIATVKDLRDSFRLLKEGTPEIASINATIISQLALIDTMIIEIIDKNHLSDILNIFKSKISQITVLTESDIPFLNSCALTIGRIASFGSKQLEEIMKNGGLEILMDLLKFENETIIITVLTTLLKLNHHIDLPDDFMKKLIGLAEKNIDKDKLLEPLIELIISKRKFQEIYHDYSNLFELFIQIILKNFSNLNLVTDICTLLNKMMDFEKSKVFRLNLEDILNAVGKSFENRRLFLNVLRLILRYLEFEKEPENNLILEKIIEFSLIENNEIINEEVEDKIMIYNANFENELIDIDTLLRLIINNLLTEEYLQIKLLMINHKIEGDLNKFLRLFKLLSEITFIPNWHSQIVKSDIIDSILQKANEIINFKSIEKPIFLTTFTKLIFALSKINNKSDVFKRVNSIINDLSQKFESAIFILSCFRNIKYWTGDKNCCAFFEEDGRKLAEKIIDYVIANLKKYNENDLITLAGIDLFISMSKTSPTLSSQLVKLGATKFLVSRLEDPNLNTEIGIKILELLKTIGSFSKEALILMNNQKSSSAIMTFLTFQNHSTLLSDMATPLLCLLSSMDNGEFSSELAPEIKILISNIDHNSPNFNPSKAFDSLDHLSNLALLDQLICTMIELNIFAVINDLIEFNFENISIGENLKNLSYKLITRIIKSKDVSEEFIKMVNESNFVKKILLNCLHSNDLLENIETIIILIRNEDNRKEVEELLIVNEHLFNFFLKTFEEIDITIVFRRFLSIVTENSSCLSKKIGNNNEFIKSILKEIREVITEKKENEGKRIELFKQHLILLQVVTELSDNCSLILNEANSFDLFLNLITSNFDENLKFLCLSLIKNLVQKEAQRSKISNLLEKYQEFINVIFSQNRSANFDCLSLEIIFLIEQSLKDVINIKNTFLLEKLSNVIKNHPFNEMIHQNIKKLIKSFDYKTLIKQNEDNLRENILKAGNILLVLYLALGEVITFDDLDKKKGLLQIFSNLNNSSFPLIILYFLNYGRAAKELLLHEKKNYNDLIESLFKDFTEKNAKIIVQILIKLYDNVDRFTIFDSNTGEITEKTSLNFSEINEEFEKNSGEKIIKIIESLSKENAINSSIFKLLGKIMTSSTVIVATIYDKYGSSFINIIQENMNNNLDLIPSCLGVITAACKISSLYDEIIKKSNLVNIILESNKLNEAETIEFFRCLTENNYDKTALLDFKILELIFPILEKEIAAEFSLNVTNTQLLRNLMKDPMFSVAILAKLEQRDLIKASLSKSIEFQKSEVAMNILIGISEAIKIPQNCSQLELFSPSFLKQIHQAAVTFSNEPTIIFQLLKILETANLISSLEQKQSDVFQGFEKYLLEATEKFISIPIIAQRIASIKKLHENQNPNKLEKLIANEIGQTLNVLSTQSSIELDPIESSGRRKRSSAIGNAAEILTKLGFVSTSFEFYLQKIEEKNVKQSDSTQIENLLTAIFNYGSSSDKRLKLWNMGVIESVVKLAFNKKVDQKLKAKATEILSKVGVESKIRNKLGSDVRIRIYLEEEISSFEEKETIEKLNEFERKHLVHLLKFMSHLLEENSTSSSSEGIFKIIDSKIYVIQLLKFLERNKSEVDLLIVIFNNFSKLLTEEKCIKEILQTNFLELVMDLYDKYGKNLEILRCFALILGIMAKNNEEAQGKICALSFHYLLIESAKKFRTDSELVGDCAFGLGLLTLGNQKITDFLIKSEMLKPIANEIVNEHLNDCELLEKILTLYHNCSIGSQNNKKSLASLGVLETLIKIFHFHAQKKDNLAYPTLKLTLQTIGNLSLAFENAQILLQKGKFIKIAEELIFSNKKFVVSKQKYSELIKLILDTITVFASFPDEINYVNLVELIDQGAMNLLTRCIYENELNTNVLMSTVTALDYLCQNKFVSKYIEAQYLIVNLLKVLKFQDWNTDLVIRGLRIYYNIINRENVAFFFEFQAIEILIDLMTAHRENSKIIFQILKLSAVLSKQKNHARKIYKLGFVSVLFESYEEIYANADNLQEFLKILSNISFHSYEGSLLICEKGIGVIKNILEESKDPKIISKCCILLENISDLTLNANLLIKDSFLQIIMNLFNSFPTNDLIICPLFKSLERLSQTSDENHKICCNLKYIEIIENLIKNNENNIEIQEIGKLTLDILRKERNIINLNVDEILKLVFKYKLAENKSLINKENKEFLMTGRVCKLFKNNGNTKEMLVFVTPDLKQIMAKRAKRKKTKRPWHLEAEKITSLVFDYTNHEIFSHSIFAKSGGLFKKKANPELCISIISDGVGDRTNFYMEISNIEEKQRWIKCLNVWLEESKRQHIMNKL